MDMLVLCPCGSLWKGASWTTLTFWFANQQDQGGQEVETISSFALVLLLWIPEPRDAWGSEPLTAMECTANLPECSDGPDRRREERHQ